MFNHPTIKGSLNLKTYKMKRILFLLMLVLMSNLALSQTTNTNLTDCLSPNQINNVFYGLKQSDYLKIRVEKAEVVVSEGGKVINEQKKVINNLEKTIELNKEIIKTTVYKADKEKEIKDITINELRQTIDINNKTYKAQKRKGFWNGMKVGAVGSILLGSVGILLLNK